MDQSKPSEPEKNQIEDLENPELNTSQNLKLRLKNKKIILLIVVILGLVILGGVVLLKISSKGNNETTDSESNNKNSSKLTVQPKLPFEYQFDNAGLLHYKDKDELYPVEFGGWGGHSSRHAGAHLEGNNKSNFRISIRPKSASVEITGNGNGACEVNELCGVTKEDAFKLAPWYTAQNEHMKLIEYNRSSGDLSPWIPGEGNKTSLTFEFDNFTLTLQHVGELSPELIKLITDAGQGGVLGSSNPTQFEKPIEVSKGMRLARPQIMAGPTYQKAGKTLYNAVGQVEWSVASMNNEDNGNTCQWKLFSDNDQKALQKSMDVDFAKPIPWGMWVGDPAKGTTIDVDNLSEAVLCGNENSNEKNYKQLSTNNSVGWIDTIFPNPIGDVFAVYPIHKESATYAANKTRFYNDKTSFMFKRAHDGSYESSSYEFTMKLGGQSFRLREVSGQIIDLQPSEDVTDHDSFIVKIDSSRPKDGGSDQLIGKFFSVRYRIEKDRVIVSWGEVVNTAESVKLPGVIAAGTNCDGKTFVCYSHDIAPKKQPN